MKSILAILATTLFAITVADGDDKVVVLTDDNFDAAIKENPFILVEFYAPWCGHCKSLAPEYMSAAAQLESVQPKVVLAKVDATENKKSAEQFGVQGFPTLKWFVSGKASEYGGGRTADTIVSWIKKKTGPATTTVSTTEELETFKKSAEVVVVGFFPTKEAAKTFETVAQGDDAVPYGTVVGASAETLKAMSASNNAIVLFKSFDEGRADYKGDVSSSDAISKFVSGNQLPLIVPFNQKTAQKIFGGGIKQHFLLFLDSTNEAMSKEIKAEAKPVAEESRGEYLFVTVDKTDTRVMEYFGVSEKDLPTARIVEMNESGMKKFKMVGGDKVTSAALRQSIKKHSAKEMTPDLKSEEPPASNDGPVKILTGKTFDAIVNAPGVDAFVEFYAPWCGHCKALAPKWEQLGEKFKDNDKMVIAKMDSTANEVEEVSIQGFPTIKLFKADSNEIVDYDGERELDAMVKFLEENASACKA